MYIYKTTSLSKATDIRLEPFCDARQYDVTGLSRDELTLALAGTQP